MNDTKEKHATFTPGPWHVRLGEDYYHVHGKVQVALVENWIAEDPRGNARLIAAAPDMYEMLLDLSKVVENLESIGASLPYYFKDDMSMSDKLREVLAKVDGGEG